MKKILLMIVGLFIMTFSSITVANAETSYTYYWGQGCQYCAKVDAYFKGVEDISKINLDRREVYYNKKNAKNMADDSKRLGIDTPGVPFLIINNDGKESYLNGSTSIIDHFKPILGEAKESNQKIIVFIILGLLAVVLPFIFIRKGK